MIRSPLDSAISIRQTFLPAFAALVFLSFQALAQEAVLHEIVISKLSGDRVQINLVADGLLDDPGSFSTSSPPRIAFDFFGMKNAVLSDLVAVDSGAVDSVVAVETDDRTREVINLVHTAEFATNIVDGDFVITIENTDVTAVRADVAPPIFERPPEIVSTDQIVRVDFRRNEHGGGKVLVDLSSPDVAVDVREQAGEIVVDFIGATLPTELERRLDVIDFATPVQTIDAYNNGASARFIIVPTGKYQHISFQSDGQFTLVVDPYIESDEVNPSTDENGFLGDRLSINFQKIDVRSALSVIADFTGLNFVTSDNVTGELTLNLQDVPWDQALDVILQTEGLAKRQTGSVVWIAPAEEIVANERAELEAQKAVADLAPLVSELIQVNYARAEDLAELLKSVRAVNAGVAPSLFGSVTVSEIETDSNSLLSARGNVTVDTRTNSLLIQDTPGKILEIRKLIAQLDQPVRQVMIETSIVEASDTFSRNLGARFGFQRVTENAEFSGVDGSNVGQFISSGSPAGLEVITNSLNDTEPGILFDTGPDGLQVVLGADSIGSASAASYAFDIFKAGTGFAHLITLELSALEADGRGKVIASPRLITSNQTAATIEQGQERIFSLQTFGSIGNLVTKKAVLSLTVLPQITPDDRVIMDVQITQDTFASAVSDTLNTKRIVTQVLSDNGETIVIGGIYQQDEFNNVTKVPILGDLPIVGNAFCKNSVKNNRTELLIFLTPRIISPKLNLG
jgi:type IV pilus assembly protein PilQ